MAKTTPIVLAVLDGFGVAPPASGNTISLAKTPTFDALVEAYPSTTLKAFGESVGLPWQEMGNSEVGHLNMGAGRIVYQDLVKINKAIDDGRFAANPAFQKAFTHVQKNRSALHIVGCLSDGGIHGHIDHIEAMIAVAKERGIKTVFVHAILDGRDVLPTSGVEYLERLQAFLKKQRVGVLATVAGRFYSMDRDERWDRIASAYKAMVHGDGETGKEVVSALSAWHQKGNTDETFPPFVVEKRGEPVGRVQDGDAVCFLNFRSDRAQQLTKAFVLPGIDDRIGRERLLGDLLFVTMTKYDENLPVEIAFPADPIPNSLGEVLSVAKKKQLRVAETEKFAHVTVFFSAGRFDPFPGEERMLVPSPPVKSYDQRPEMSAEGITSSLITHLRDQTFDFYLVNYANADMVGHTANESATIQAIECIDDQLRQLWEAIQEKKGVLLITADHGNAEMVRRLQDGSPDTSHTANPVPFVLCDARDGVQEVLASSDPALALWEREPVGVLADIAPTVLDLMNVPIPPEMTGTSLYGMI